MSFILCQKCNTDVDVTKFKKVVKMCIKCYRKIKNAQYKNKMKEYYENNKDELLIQGIKKYYNTSRENLVFHKKANGRFRVTQILNSCDKETQCE